MRVAWFSPLPPVRSGIAIDTADLVARLDECDIDCFVDRTAVPSTTPDQARVFDAHDFVWRQRRHPYDLVTYQLGNARWHDYMWAYLARYPGLVVLHDPLLHQARARQLLSQQRFDDYRREFWYDHPDAPRDVVEYAVEGLGGPIYYLWSMLPVVMRTARFVAVHNERVAADLREEFPDTPIAAIRLGKPPLELTDVVRDRARQALGLSDSTVLFAVFGKITAEKRIGPILRAFASLVREGADVHLLLAGDGSDDGALSAAIARDAIADRVRVAGYVEEAAVVEALAAADVCLCLRWPTARETSASWLQCLTAARPTLITNLAHLVDIPTVDPRTRRASHASASPVAVGIDLLDEEASLLLAMRRLAADRGVRDTLAGAGYRYWSAGHTQERAASDYRRILAAAAERPVPVVPDLPAHFTNDHGELARSIARQFAVEIDVLGE